MGIRNWNLLSIFGYNGYDSGTARKEDVFYASKVIPVKEDFYCLEKLVVLVASQCSEHLYILSAQPLRITGCLGDGFGAGKSLVPAASVRFAGFSATRVILAHTLIGIKGTFCID